MEEVVLSLEQILAAISPQKRYMLERKITDDCHLADIAKSLTNWKSVCAKLGINEVEEEEIQADNPRLDGQKLALLRKWRSKNGPRATYQRLAMCFYSAERPDMVEVICKVIDPNTSDPQAAIQPSYSSTWGQPAQQQQSMQPNPPSHSGDDYAGLNYPPDIKDLMNEIAVKLPDKWQDIGRGLELEQHELKQIHAQHGWQQSTNQFFSAVFDRWYSGMKSPYTWAQILKVLCEPAVGEKRLADELKTKYRR